MLTIKVQMIFDSSSYTRSVMETIKELRSSNNNLVANLILLFSVIVPVSKGLALLVVVFSRNKDFSKLLFKIVNSIGKWSMADVFVVGIYIAFLSANAQKPIMTAHLQQGFYYFTGYCIVSIASLHFFKVKD